MPGLIDLLRNHHKLICIQCVDQASNLDIFITDMYGISDHDLMFTKEAQMQAQDGAETQYVAQRVSWVLL